MAYNPARTIYVRSTSARKKGWRTFNDVVSTQEGWRRMPAGLYRNEFTAANQVKISAAGSGATESLISAIGVQDAAPTVNSWTNLRFTAPDSQTHTPPRQRYEYKNGLYIQTGANAIPELPDPDTGSAVFAAAAATDVLTVASGTHPFLNGDIVTGSASTGGFSTSTLYTVVYLSTTTLKLMSAGAILNVSLDVASLTLSLVSTVAPPDHLPEGVFFVPDYEYSDTLPA